MRILSTLRSARAPQREPVPFDEILPLRLKATVSGKGSKTSNVACLQEMAIMFACFKNNDFNQELCSKEIGTFQKCYKTFLDDKQIRKNEEQKGIITPGDKNLSSKQLNKYLKRFPPN
ncbi:hypothetical protein C0J52_01075 [Blattella germanica]|nr:hypothetical protein C0J52_01075 [Blattella germanica]PSN54694.1 hypothetical protein C0J52_01075 [Blattella germanica]